MAMNKARIKKAAEIQVPQNRGEVAADIRQIGDLNREQTRQAAAMNDEIAAITQKYQPGIDALKDQIETLTNGVQTWCEANRVELTNNNKVKSANLVTGEVQWRIRPPSVAVRNQDAVIDALQKGGLSQFIRTKEEVNREAILNDPAAVRGIPGIRINSGIEDFVIVPFEQEVD